jgi:hypothetical protein
LEQAYQEREPWLAHIQYLPYLDFVHSEPRYKAIVKRMGLSPAWDESSKAGIPAPDDRASRGAS